MSSRGLVSAGIFLLLVAATEARGQSSSTQAALLGAGPALAGAVICDVGMVLNYSGRGHVRRGWSITGTVFSSISTLISGIMLIEGVSSGLRSEYLVLTASMLSVGLGSLAISIFSLFHGPPSEPEPPELQDTPVTPAYAPQLQLVPHLLPLPRGDWAGGAALRLRW